MEKIWNFAAVKELLLVLCLCVTVAPAQNCRGTGAPPRKTLGITFCKQFTDNACCTPALDAENEEMFTNLVNLGASCRLRGDIRDHPMAKFYCMNCHPNEPNFVVDTKVYICQSWADRVFGSGSNLFKPHRLDECGLYVAGPCPGKDRYLCGDDLIIPSGTASGTGAGVDIVSSAQQLLNYSNIGPPLYEEDFNFIIVNDTYMRANNIVACFDHASFTSPSPIIVGTLLVFAMFLVFW